MFARFAIIFSLLLPVALWAQDPNLPLGDVVKLPKPARRAKRVITNDDIPSRPPAPAPSAASSTPSEADGKDKDKDKAEGSPSPGNRALARRMQDLKDAELTERQMIRVLEEKLDDSTLTAQQRQGYTDSLAQAKAKLESYEQQHKVLQDLTGSADRDKTAADPEDNPQPAKTSPEDPAAAANKREKPGSPEGDRRK